MVSTTVGLTQTTIWTKAVVSLFDRSRGLAMAVTLCGSGLGSAFAPVLATELIASLGWQLAYPALAAVGGLVTLPLLLLLFRDGHTPIEQDAMASPMPARERWSISPALRTARFVRLALVAILGTTPMMALTINFVPMAVAAKLPAIESASIAGVIGIAAIIGRLVAGMVVLRLPPAWVSSITLLLAAAPSLVAAVHGPSAPVLWCLAICLGIATGTQAQNFCTWSLEASRLPCSAQSRQF